EQPRREGASGIVPIERPEDPDERLLGDVLRILPPAQHAQGHRVHLPPVAVDELPVGSFVPCPAPSNDLGVFTVSHAEAFTSAYGRPGAKVAWGGTIAGVQGGSRTGEMQRPCLGAAAGDRGPRAAGGPATRAYGAPKRPSPARRQGPDTAGPRPPARSRQVTKPHGQAPRPVGPLFPRHACGSRQEMQSVAVTTGAS